MAKKQVLEFTAAWVPEQQEKPDANLGFSGVIQTLDGKPTGHPAHVVLREYEEGDKPSWFPGITDPAKKEVTYGPTFQDEYPYTTDLHQVKIEKGQVFSIKDKDGLVRRYRIEKVEDLTA